MKKYLSLVLFASMMQFAQGAADEVANADGKIYVRPRAVRLLKRKTVVFTKDGAFVTPTLSRDENGLFVMAKDLEKAPDFFNKVFERRQLARKAWAEKRASGISHKRFGKKGNGRGYKQGWKKKAGCKNKMHSSTPPTAAE